VLVAMLPLDPYRVQGNPMNLTRNSIIAGVTALSLAASASPAVAKGGGDGGGDINNTVISISPTAPAPVINSGGGGGGGGGRSTKCTSTIDPITGIGIGICSTARA
jgi:hypothetical protein